MAPLPEVFANLHPGAAPRRFNPAVVDTAVEAALRARYGPAPTPGWIIYHDQPHLYLNPAALRARRVTMEDAERVAQAAIMSVPGVHEALTSADLATGRARGLRSAEVLSFYPGRSGNIYYQMEPYILVDDEPTGTGHGTRGPTTSRCRCSSTGAGSCPACAAPRRPSPISRRRCRRCSD